MPSPGKRTAKVQLQASHANTQVATTSRLSLSLFLLLSAPPTTGRVTSGGRATN